MAAKTAAKTKRTTATKAKKTTTAKTSGKTGGKTTMKASAKTAKATAQKTSKTSGKTGGKTTAKAASATKANSKSKKSAATTKRTLNPALKAPYTPSAQLAQIVGETPLPRQEVVSKLWKYIKANGLQDKQTINADDKLKPIFGNKKSVTMFEMQKHVSKHLTK